MRRDLWRDVTKRRNEERGKGISPFQWYYNVCEAEAFRFREPNTVVEEEGLVNKTIPTSTKYKNKWAVTIFNEWLTVGEVQVPVLDSGGMFNDYDLHKVGVLSTRIKDMDALSLNYWLSKFVMEDAKKNGERYPPKTVYGIVCGIRRYLEEKNGAEGLNPLIKMQVFDLTRF